MEKAGISWPVRKVAGMMNVTMEIDARDDGLFVAVKTKLKNSEVLILYNGISHDKGLDGEDIEIKMTFDDNNDANTHATVTKDGKVKYTANGKYTLLNDQLVVSRTINGVTGTRYFARK